MWIPDSDTRYHVLTDLLTDLRFITLQTEDCNDQPKHMGTGLHDYYMRAQGRALVLLELWAIARGDDLRPITEDFVSVSKLHGVYVRQGVVGPDQMYKMQILKDVAKHNKTGKNELIGNTRNKDPLLCAMNAMTTVIILRYGTKGVLGQLPDFFDITNDWPNYSSLFTTEDGTGQLPYSASGRAQGQLQLFQDMKRAAGLTEILDDTATKLRSYGAMAALEGQAPSEEVERSGR
jgi:hypothetical protein